MNENNDKPRRCGGAMPGAGRPQETLVLRKKRQTIILDGEPVTVRSLTKDEIVLVDARGGLHHIKVQN